MVQVNIDVIFKMKDLINKYNIQARLIPSILIAIPLFLFQYVNLDSSQINFLKQLGEIEFLGNITISIALIYFFMQLNRYLGKHLFEKYYFKKQLYFPTTTWLMLYDTSLSENFKTKLRTKIQSDFNIVLLNIDEEQENDNLARKTIRDANGLIRRKVGNGKLTLQHNIEYGFFRNLIGGTIIALPITVIIFLINLDNNNFILGLTVLLGFIYSLLLIFSKQILWNKGCLYAEILFQEFMTQ